MPPAFVLAGQSNMLRNQANVEILLKRAYGSSALAVKTAVGGTSIIHWQRGQQVYQDALGKALQAQASGHLVKAILFHQGETDAKLADVAPRWKELFLRFLYDFRQDISRPNIPVVFAQLGDLPGSISDWSFWKTIRTQQTATLEAEPTWRMVQTVGLPYKPNDIPHYPPKPYLTIANRFVNNTTIVVPP